MTTKKRIAFIGGPKEDYSSGKMRLKGFKRAVDQFELEVPNSYIVHGDFSYESGYEGIGRLYRVRWQ